MPLRLRVSAGDSPPSRFPQRPMPWAATEERFQVHEGDPPAETQRRGGLEPMPLRLRVSARDSLPKQIPKAAHAMGGNRGASPLIPASAVLECPVLASRGAAGGWTQQDFFAASWLRVIKKTASRSAIP